MHSWKAFSKAFSAQAHSLHNPLFKKAWAVPKSAAQWIVAESNQTHQFDIAVDCRVSTEYTQRNRYFGLSAETLCEFAQNAALPTIAFFPSYQYAESIVNYLRELYPQIPVSLQIKNASVRENEQFFAEALLSSRVIGLVLGGHFSESINALSGRVNQAMIFGPALPEINYWNNHRIEQFYPGAQAEGFQNEYQIPAIKKIGQALGRFIRSPEDRAKILLHCRRFSQNEYLDLMQEAHKPNTFIHNDSDLQQWIT